MKTVKTFEEFVNENYRLNEVSGKKVAKEIIKDWGLKKGDSISDDEIQNLAGAVASQHNIDFSEIEYEFIDYLERKGINVDESYSVNENAKVHMMADELEAGYLADTDFDPRTMPNAREIEKHHKSGKYEYILNKRFHGETMDWDEIKKRLSKARIKFIELKDSDDGDDQILF